MKKIYFRHIAILCVISFVLSFAAGEPAVSEEAAFGSAGKITLDLKGMDIIEVLKTLAAKGNLNVVVGANVRGRVTMFLKDVDIKDAFEIILVANNLASDKKDDIIYVMTQKDYQQLYGEMYGDTKEVKIIQLKYAKAPEAGKALNLIKTRIGKIIIDEASNSIIIIDTEKAVSQAVDLMTTIDKPTRTVVFELNYAKAEDLKEKIDEILTKGVGMAQVDERTNKIAVTDTESNLEKIEEVITAFDDKLKQVLIEAKIIEITLSDRYRLGVDWHAVMEEFEKNITLTGGFKLAATGSLIPGAEAIIGTFGTGDYAAMIQALQTVGDANILSSPRITVLNNEEAKILVGSSEPYATNTVTQGTSTTTTATSLTFLDLGVKLYVTPTINNDGFVTIKVKPEVSSSSGTYTYGDPATTVPIVSTTNAETNVMVKDGTTIIIAGLIKDERSGTKNKVPILGDIPLLGLAFQNTDNSVEKKELVIFLTPHIISGETDYIKQPKSPPIGDKKFTMPERPGFERRRPREMDPDFFKRGRGRKSRKELDAATATPEDYFHAVRNKITRNISVSEKEAKSLEYGDKVKVSFSLYSGGNLIYEPEIIESSNIFFEKTVLDAIEESVPLPAFPMSIKETRREFILDIVYEKKK
jgi:MSHA type pilus biogenesis protein MshL